MTPIQRKLRRAEFDRLVEARLATPRAADSDHKTTPRLAARERAAAAQDDLHDLWDNVPV